MRFSILLTTILLFALSIQAQLSPKPSVQTDSFKQKYISGHKALNDSFATYFYPQIARWLSLPERSFEALIDSGRLVSLHQLAGYKKRLEKGYIREQQDEVRFDFDLFLTYYLDQHEIYTGTPYPASSLISERLEKNLPDFNRLDLLKNADFTDYAKAWLDFRIRRERSRHQYSDRDNQWLLAAWKIIPELIRNDSCRTFWRYIYLQDQIDNNGIKNIETVYADFKAGCRDTAYLHKIESLYTDDSTGRLDHLIRVYKQVGNFSLDIHIFLPDSSSHGLHPAMVYFHGGSWSEGKPDWFFWPCRSDAGKGWVSCAVEYRLYGRHGASPFDAVRDARSAIRWLRKHAAEYGIDTSRIVASGNSAGGHLVLTAAMADNWNESTDDLSLSPAPNLLLVNSGVFDLTAPSWFNKAGKDISLVKQISPTFLVRNGLPPTLIIHGTNDGNVPCRTAQAFATAMTARGNAFEFRTIDGAHHFIWYDPRYSGQVGQFRSDFLHKWGY